MAISFPAVASLAAIGLALATCHRQPPKAVEQARVQAATATADADLATKSASHSDRAAARAAQSQAVADQAEDEVQHAPTASAPIDPGLRAAVLAGVRRMCEQSDSAGTPACDPGAPDQAVPAS